MEILYPEEASTQKASIEPKTNTLSSSKESSKKFYKKVFETIRYDLYNKLFDHSAEEVQNYMEYDNLRKGEKRILEFFVEEYGVKDSTILPIMRGGGKVIIGNKNPFFTPLTSDTKKNVRRSLKNISLGDESKLIELAKSILAHGIQEPKHNIEMYNVDYNAIQCAVNNVSSKVYSMEEIVTAIALIGHFERYQSLSIGKKVWGAIFRHSDYKAIIEVLIELNILTKTGNSIVGWRPNIYSFNIYPLVETYTITEKKVLNRIKNTRITFCKNSLKKQLEMAEKKDCLHLVDDIKILIEGYKYLDNGRDKRKLKEEYKWIQYESMLISFSIHFQKQKKIAQEVGIYKSFWYVIGEPRLKAFAEFLRESGISVDVPD